MKKAKLRVDSSELAYCKKYGVMPDRHFEKLLGEKCEKYRKDWRHCNGECHASCTFFDEVGDMINANMHAIWEEQKALHGGAFVGADDIPFA